MSGFNEEKIILDTYQQTIHKSRYARWDEETGKRETWEETCQRYVDFWISRDQLSSKDAKIIYEAIHDMRVMPSMRCMWTAGEALNKNNVAGYNCSFVPVDNPRAFDETMFILMAGTGVGFSVESQFVNTATYCKRCIYRNREGDLCHRFKRGMV